MNPCICGSGGGREFKVVERQLGFLDEFTYVECADCGSLRISEAPADLAKYYAGNYYSFSHSKNWRENLQPFAMRIGLRFSFPKLSRIHFHFPAIAQAIKIKSADRVLDVGSGLHGLATVLRKTGHRGVLGVDPFVSADFVDEAGKLLVKKAFLEEIDEEWDVIAFNHSLEHIPDPISELKKAKSLLAPAGRIIVRIPVVSYAYREYGSNWFQIDAPRHLFVPSERGFEVASERAGLRIVDIQYDSTYLQFWQSENYRRGKTVVHPGSAEYWGLITRSERRKLNQRAERLNRAKQGDQAIFFLERS